MEPIKLTENLRVNDFDALQYTIERYMEVTEGKNAGKGTWTPIAYCREVKHLADNAKERVGDYYAAMGRKSADAKFDEMGIGELLSALPDKSKKG